MGIFSAADLLVAGSGIAAWVYTVSALLPASNASAALSAPWVAVALGVSTSHVLYASVWYHPTAFRRMCEGGPLQPLGENAVAVFALLVAAAKGVQQLSVGLWAVQHVGGTGRLLDAMDSTRWVSLGVLLACGQMLNGAIYRAIGKDGVYYGFKLGRPVPWCHDFPFNVGFRHPQYVGGLLSQLGVLVLLTTTETMEAGLLPLVGWWTVLYGLTSWMEAVGDNDAKME